MAIIGTESVADRARRLIEPVLERDGYALVEVEWKREGRGWFLRLFVDRPGGVTVEHCQEVSRTIEPILDVEDFIEPAYQLEVSSPGLDRPLRKPSDFQRFAGQRAHIRAYGPVESLAASPRAVALAPAVGAKAARKNWTGILRGFRDGAVEIEVDGQLHRIAHDQIAKANLECDVEADLRRKE
jgi:ribosome maturation factor RimP